MEALILFFYLLGGLGVFLLGLEIMSEGLQKTAGQGLRKILSLATANLRAAFRFSLLLIILAEALTVYYFGLGHPYFSFEKIPAFGSLYGFFSCVVIILASKFLGKLFISKKEDYYD
ncbi:MAG: hypothetical protein KKH28_05910 [Elusimicrobia bacterium]|nr:hypothetical protein [Elusimicrobiota bacterium]